jgi:hypothetical protein
MSINKKQQSIKKAMIESLSATMGNVSEACKQVGIDRTTHYKYLKADPDYKQAVADVESSTGDWVESKMRELISGVKTITPSGEVYQNPPCKTSIIFYAKTKMKDRGYIERTEQVIEMGEDAIKKLAVEFIDGTEKKEK